MRKKSAGPACSATAAGFRDLSLGLMAGGEIDEESGAALFALVQQIAAAGGTVILAANDPLAAHPAFSLNGADPSLAFAQRPAQPGLHLMANPGTSWSETMTGLGAAGVEAIVALCTTRGQQGHPFIPVLQAASAGHPARPFHADMDLLLAGDPQQRLEQLLAQISAVLSRTIEPKLTQQNNVTFQITRGQLGVSL